MNTPIRLGRASAILGLLLVVLTSAACRVDATVTVDVAENGTGHVDLLVELDAGRPSRFGYSTD